MTALHALEDHVVAGLRREMEMRHQPRLLGDGAHQLGIGLDGIDGGEPEPRHFRHQLQQLAHQRAQRRCARQVGAVGGEVDAGEHDLGKALRRQPSRLRDHRAEADAARVPAAIRDDAEGAAVVAAVLHLKEGAAAAVEAVDHLRRGLLHGHDVVDAHALGIVEEARGLELLGIAQHRVDLFHRRIGRGLGLRRAAGDDDARARPLAPRAADRLARLAHGFRRHRAGVEDHRVFEAGFGRARLHAFRLIGVQTAAEGDDLDHAA